VTQARPTLLDEVDAANRRLVRRSLVALVASAVVAVVVATALAGLDGFVGAAVGSALVVAFYGVDLVMLRSTREWPPMSVLAVVAMVFTLKITLLAVFLVALRGTEAFSSAAFGGTVILLTTVALGGALVVVARRKVPVVDPAPRPEPGSTADHAG
jgi:ATP synthase protein I